MLDDKLTELSTGLSTAGLSQESLDVVQERTITGQLASEDIDVLRSRIMAAKCDSNYLRCDKGYSSAA